MKEVDLLLLLFFVRFSLLVMEFLFCYEDRFLFFFVRGWVGGWLLWTAEVFEKNI